jgi:DnaK suppressor protein
VKPADLDRYKDKLLALRSEILSEGDLAIEPARKDATEVGGDEDAAPLTEMNQVIASKRNRSRTHILAKVTAALGRIEQEPDMFGVCLECEEPIGRRLELMPYADMCIECQSGRDDKPKLGSRKSVTDYS